MRSPAADTAIEALRDADPDVMERDQLAGVVDSVRQVRAWCDSIEVRVSRRTRDLAAEGRSEAPESLLTGGGRNSTKDAHAAGEREQVCGQMPAFEEALGAGTVTAAHVDALAHVTRNLDEQTQAEFTACEADLLADATTMRPEAFERNCRDLVRNLIAQKNGQSDAAELDAQRKRSCVKRWTDQQTGMRHTHLELDPLRDESIWKAIRHQLAKLRRADGNRRTPWAELEVQAVVNAISTAAADAPNERIPEILLLVDDATLRDGVHEHTICETENGIPVPISTVRRLCCEAEIVPVVIGDDRQALAVGRTVRTATRAQRRALAAMYRTCANPDCTAPFDQCRIHHVNVSWHHHGPTDLDNLIPLCERCHHLVHEGGWGLKMRPDRTTTWTRPDATIYYDGPSTDRQPATRAPARASPR